SESAYVAGGVLARICYPVADELGQFFADKIRNWRYQNFRRFEQKVENLANLQQLPNDHKARPKLAHKIIEEASWSDNDLIQSKWAGLLISSCSDSGEDESNLIFHNILSQLTRTEVQILDYSCKNAVLKANATG